MLVLGRQFWSLPFSVLGSASCQQGLAGRLSGGVRANLRSLPWPVHELLRKCRLRWPGREAPHTNRSNPDITPRIRSPNFALTLSWRSPSCARLDEFRTSPIGYSNGQRLSFSTTLFAAKPRCATKKCKRKLRGAQGNDDLVVSESVAR